MLSSAPPSALVAYDVKPFVPARDFDISLQFYQDLGWAMNWWESALAELDLGGARMLLQDVYVPEWAENFMLYVAFLPAVRHCPLRACRSHIRQASRTSATLQACAIVPRGVKGGSPSKISLMCPRPWSPR